MGELNTLGMAHRFLRKHVVPGAFCIDATAGRGYDTAFLCELVGEAGHVLALDIQPEAVESTCALLRQRELSKRATVVCDSHSNMAAYAQDETADCIVFNFGYLPKGDHSIGTKAETSIAAIEAGLRILKPHGVMSLCLYYGGESGYEERDALTEYLKTIDSRRYTVLYCTFHNRPNNPPIPVFVWKDT